MPGEKSNDSRQSQKACFATYILKYSFPERSLPLKRKDYDMTALIALRAEISSSYNCLPRLRLARVKLSEILTLKLKGTRQRI
ncbi:hypothetical protein BTUL_0040g00420 [Botrytis tulipae]|uniref:Uncharacterized protein n=1 Tax=Botrytis tulipae TaxID=87230 RepID=A0A4Z1EST7_9HELO|nr:hypothetical protein BTUL_0040g00420 [Botrytis tulipae]